MSRLKRYIEKEICWKKCVDDVEELKKKKNCGLFTLSRPEAMMRKAAGP